MNSPSVSVITPTTEDRYEFNERIIQIVANQDYPNVIEHLFDYSRFRVGRKRNNLCKEAKGNIIVNMDSDDIYSPDWISKSVEYLLNSQYAIVGLREGYFISGDKIYKNIYPKGSQPCLLGASAIYYREAWAKVRYVDKPYGEDVTFCNDIAKAGLLVGEHDYIKGFLATVHDGNTSIKRLNNAHAFKRVMDYALPIGMRLP